jgi:uncharacterized repeat protein (TIGR03843 family)
VTASLSHQLQPDLAAQGSDQVLEFLAKGDIAVEGLIPWSSNATLLVTVQDAGHSTLAVYKPQRGEAPLWDFDTGTLGKREVAAYLLCGALGWGFVPPTVLRRGPYGPGSVQLFVHARKDEHFFTIREHEAYTADLRRLAAFDVIVNNADRKSGHCLLDLEGRLWAIDNALTFHAEPKLRTVIWDYAGQPLPSGILADVGQLAASLAEGSALSRKLAPLLSNEELAALRDRLHTLIRHGRFPQPGPGRAIPWPLV